MNFINLLVDPESKEPLKLDPSTNELFCQGSDKRYRILENIPVIRLEKEIKPQETGVHKKFNSPFDYLDHYEKDAEFFDYFEEPSDKATLHERKRLRETITNRIPSGDILILDVGCGDGWVARSQLKKGKNVISMDIASTNPIKVLKENPSENHFGLVANAFQLPLKDKSVDCIIASEIIEHVPNPKEFILSLIKVIKPGGKLIITTPYNEKIEYNLCVHCNKPTPRNAHLHSFNEQNISKLKPSYGDFTYKKFSNKFLIKLKTHIILSLLPFKLWRIIDSIINKIFKNETRLLIEIKV